MPPDVARPLGVAPGVYSLRPEKIDVLPAGAAPADGALSVAGSVVNVLYQGAVRRVQIDAGGFTLHAAVPVRRRRDRAGHGGPRRLRRRPSLHRMEDAW